jgi:hypothetical protein
MRLIPGNGAGKPALRYEGVVLPDGTPAAPVPVSLQDAAAQIARDFAAMPDPSRAYGDLLKILDALDRKSTRDERAAFAVCKWFVMSWSEAKTLVDRVRDPDDDLRETGGDDADDRGGVEGSA